MRGFKVCKKYDADEVELPKRSTTHSAGYDFRAIEDLIIPSIWGGVFSNVKAFLSGSEEFSEIKPHKVHTGIKAYYPKDEVLYLFNRSSGPLKKGLIMANSVGVIDPDYYENEENDGELIFCFYNFFPRDTEIKKGEKIGQAIFQKILLADEDEGIKQDRKGGFGSTGQ